MTADNRVQPFLKWAGGKRQLLTDICKHLPPKFDTYYEPFIGGGAVLFHLRPKQAVISDVNAELVNAYQVIRDHVDELIADLAKHRNEKAYYYKVRALDRQAAFSSLSPVERASRLIYLNKTCYNGLFRVNSRGQFNVPFGDYRRPNIVNERTLRAVHQYLSGNHVQILHADFAATVASAKPGDLVYLDPPYDPVSETASFTSYSLHGFGREEQLRLKQVVDDLTERGCYVLLSNSATDFTQALYQDYRVVFVEANRFINSNVVRRGKVAEVLVMNY